MFLIFESWLYGNKVRPLLIQNAKIYSNAHNIHNLISDRFSAYTDTSCGITMTLAKCCRNWAMYSRRLTYDSSMLPECAKCMTERRRVRQGANWIQNKQMTNRGKMSLCDDNDGGDDARMSIEFCAWCVSCSNVFSLKVPLMRYYIRHIYTPYTRYCIRHIYFMYIYFHNFGLGGEICDGLISRFWGCFHYYK